MENQRKRSELQNVEDILMLTPMQEGILYHYLNNRSSEEYFEQFNLRIDSPLQVEIFKTAFQWVIQTNEVLRTVFRWKQVERPVQIVLKDQPMEVGEVDLSAVPRDDWDSKITELCSLERQRPFDLEKGPLLRLVIYKLAPECFHVVVSYHHILFDGWSTGVIFKELLSAYQSLVEGRELVKAQKEKFKDYLRWLKSQNQTKDRAYWRDYLEGFDTKTVLPEYQSLEKLKGGEMHFPLSSELVKRLEEVAKQVGVTLPIIFNAAWGILLQRYNNHSDVVFGTTVSGRPADLAGVEEMVGLFINTLPLRVRKNAGETVEELLHKLQREQSKRQVFEYTPLVTIKGESELGVQGELFDLLLVIENYPLEQVLTGAKNRMEAAAVLAELPTDGIYRERTPLVEPLRITECKVFERTNFPLTIVVSLWDGVKVSFIYAENRFTTSTVERWGQYLINLLEDMCHKLQRPVAELDFLMPAEREVLLQSFNATQNQYLQEMTICQLFAERVREIPEATAVSYQGVNWSYRELGARVQSVAIRLRELGVRAENIIAIMTEPSLEMVTGIYATLQAGGAYLPIDPHTPIERVRFILSDSGVKVLLTQKKWASRLSEITGVEVLPLDDYTQCELTVDDEIKLDWAQPEAKHLAYVIYTSGSTGRPKGVLIEHQSLMNLLVAMQNEYPIETGDVWLLKTPFTFDVSLTEIFGWILGKGRLAILEPGGEKDPRKIIDAIEHYQVTHLNFVPSMYNAFLEYLEVGQGEVLQQLKYLMVAGEAISLEQVRRFYDLIPVGSTRTKFVNLYGPTEATIYATHFPLEQAEGYRSVPIGRGMANTQLYILGQDNNLQPIGFPGELCIAGDGLARGYLNQPELSSEKFVANPFAAGRMYRTGDLARWLHDGNVEFLGRLDYQVKIRGFRIEIGEIENQLLRHPEVQEVVVIARKDEQGLPYLCAYLVAKGGHGQEGIGAEVSALKEYLAKVLPDYMIPAQFVWLKELPLNANGKVNRKELPEPLEVSKVTQEYEPPRNEIEKRLCEIWQDIFGIQGIGIRDNFFDLGGHSLKAIQLVAKIYKEWQVEVGVRQLLSHPTIAELGEYLESLLHGNNAVQYGMIPRQIDQRFYPVSSAQRRLYLLQQMEPETLAYNLPMALVLRGKVEVQRLETVLNQLIARHESLRTQFVLQNGEPVQEILPVVQFQLQFVEMESILLQQRQEEAGGMQGENGLAKLVTELGREFLRPFDLSHAPLLRAKVVRFTEERYLLLLDLHHIIADGISLDIIVEEFTRLYAREELPSLPLQYRDYAVWQGEFMASEQVERAGAFWLKEFQGEIPVLELPTDYQCPVVQDFTGDVFDHALEPALVQELKALAADNDVTLFMILFALYKVFLHKYTGQEDIIVGTPTAGRPHPDLHQVVGMFVNTVAVRSKPQAAISFKRYLAELKESVLQALEHQDYPFELLVDRLSLARDLSRNPLFDTLFLLQSPKEQSERVEITGVQVDYLPLDAKIAKFDVSLMAEEVGEGLNLRFEYSTRLFRRETIGRMANHFGRLVKEVITHPDRMIRDLDMLSAEEKDRLLFGLNDTRCDYPEKTIDELFTEQAYRTPKRIALTYAGNHWTYAELNSKAEGLAHLLKARGVEREQIVGLMIKRSPEMIIGILGILKAGAAYIPLDAALPTERKQFLLQDAGVQVLLTREDVVATEDWAKCGGLELIDLQEITNADGLMTAGTAWAHDAAKVNDRSIVEYGGKIEGSTLPSDSIKGMAANHQATSMKGDLNQLAYVMYTSGSTGQPKGVQVLHRGVVRLLFNTNYLQLDENEKIMQIAPYSFDASTLEIWAALLFGGELILVPEETVLSIDKLAMAIWEEEVTTCWLTSSLFNRVIDEAPEGLKRLKNLLVGGEALSVPHVEKARQLLPDTRLINGYGPTENTTFTCCYEIGEIPNTIRSIPIGSPISNTRVYILDANLKLVPEGAVGEIYIAGDGLARGYLNRDELTRERFILNPLIPEEIIYKSGDLARYLPDGNIEFLGRRDHQVKIRGFRIELGEVEAALTQHQAIRNAAVDVKVDSEQNKYLAAYIELAEGLTVEEVRTDLLKTLPEYMVPNLFITLDHLPLTANGKVDRKALPELGEEVLREREYLAPCTQLEETLSALFSKVLGVQRVGVRDNFFTLGGHSLKAAQLTAEVAKELKVELPLRQLFQNPTVKELAKVMENLTKKVIELIPIQPEMDYYPASSAQRRVFILQRIGGEQTGYNIPSATMIRGELQLERFEQAFKQVIERHESLRTVFKMVKGLPVQQILPAVEFRVSVEECMQLTSTEEINTKIRALIRPFDLGQSPLMRVHLLQLAVEQWLMVLDLHHIITDGISMENLITDLAKAYGGETLEPLPVQYRDYAVWQNGRLVEGKLADEKEYWLAQLSDTLPILELPTDYSRPKVQTFAGGTVHSTVNAELTYKLKNLADSEGVTLFVLLLSAYNLLLARLTGQEDVIVGTPTSGRVHPDVQNLIGMFVNTLALRSYPAREKSFATFVKEVQADMLQALENQEYPFDMLVDDLRLERNLSRNPLFDTMFDLQNMEIGGNGLTVGALTFKPYDFDEGISKFDLNLSAQERHGELQITMSYALKLFKEETAERFVRYYLTILEEIVKNPETPLGIIPLLQEEEREEILYGLNRTERSYPTDCLIHQLFEEFAVRQPASTALIVSGKKMTYGELNARANRLAHLLRRKGVGVDTLVAIMLDRSMEMIIAVLAVFKAGGAYVPIDPSYPLERIRFMLGDSEAKILLTEIRFSGYGVAAAESESSTVKSVGFTGEVLVWEDLEATWRAEGLKLIDLANPQPVSNLTSLAYVIYTSGSTGKPKGVMVEHRNLLNSHYSWQEQYELNVTKPVLLQLASFSFDVFIADLCRSICSGGTMVIANNERSSLPALYTLLTEHQVTIVNSTPGLLLPLLEYISKENLPLPALRYLLIGADSWHLRDYRRLVERFGNQFIICNCYGVTEAAVDATWFKDKETAGDGVVPIGRPIGNVQVYILDEMRNPAPIGVIGEIYIGGLGVARGYLNRPELTQERFLANPFYQMNSDGSEARVYKTGDRGRYLSDGNIEFLGRIDHQVKVRGYRIEIGEIEATLLRHPKVEQAVVVARTGNDGNKYLTAYLIIQPEIERGQAAPIAKGHATDLRATQNILESDSRIIQEIRRHLAEELPEYMIPEHIICVQSFPLTPNGKVDLQALPEVRLKVKYHAPRTEVESRLARLWESGLGMSPIGVEDNFFKLGGHSLKGMQMLAEVYKEFQVELPLAQLFTNPVLKDLAQVIAEAREKKYTAIPRLSEANHYPVSSAQKRLFILNKIDPFNTTYNMPVVLKCLGNLDIAHLKQALQALVQRHESLRTIFTMVNGVPVQQVLEDVVIDVQVIELDCLVSTEDQLIRSHLEQFVKPFDLQQAPLLRIKLLRFAEDDHVLMLDMHHIISDGVSMDILTKELAVLYSGGKLPVLQVQYKDYAVWQNQQLVERQGEMEKYWLQKFSNELPLLNLPTDYPRPQVFKPEGKSYDFLLPAELWAEVQKHAIETGTTIYMLLLSAYSILLAKYSSQEDIIIGSPVAGRTHPDVQTVVGMFVNTLAMRHYPVQEKSISTYLDEVKADTLAAFQHQDYQFELLIDRLKLERDMSRTPLFDAAFVLQNTANLGKSLHMTDVSFREYRYDNQVAKFDLSLIVEEGEQGLGCSLNYRTALFTEETIERMANHWTNVLQVIVTTPEKAIGQIDMLSDTERQRIVYEWNQTDASYPEHSTIHQIFEEQAALHRNRVALTYGNEQMTYGELNQKANQVANVLRQKGAGAEVIVGILVERSFEMMVGVLGIIKAGSAYLPMDPEYPVERLEYMLSDAEVPILLTQSTLAGLVPVNFTGAVLYLDENHWYKEQCSENLPSLTGPDNLLYVIYTSGSTGRPKGVMLDPRNLLRLLKTEPAHYQFSENDVWALFFSYCFDFSVWEIFGALLFGGRLVIIDQEIRVDPIRLVELCKRERVTVLNQTPGAFYNFIQAELTAKEHTLNQHLRYVIFGGEALNFSKLIPWVRLYPLEEIALINMYGITETTVHSTFERIREEDLDKGKSLVGRPIYTMKIYILDKMGNPMPVGVPGEICCGGPGVARGYLKRPELTAERFIPSPFVEGDRLYRSGDLAKFLPDGNIEYLSRIDHQVKIRGFRVEIGEIEESLRKYPRVLDAVVLQRTDRHGGNYLAAYIVSAKPEPTVQELKAYLLTSLPDYMVPAVFIYLEKLPLTANGKVNRKALPEPQFGAGVSEYQPPRDEVEERLVVIWAQTLQVERVGVLDNFFELGGNSLLLIKVFTEIKQVFGEVELKVADLFKYPTISALAQYIRGGQLRTEEMSIDDDEIEEFIM